jgi:preprotein translocase subunit SecG
MSPHSPAPMNLAAIDWLSISINLLLVVFVLVCFLMTVIILMQRPKQEGLGAAFGAGVTDQVFGARTTNVLQKGTVYLGSLFFLLSLALAVLIGHQNKNTSLVAPKVEATAEAAKEEKPAEEVKPKSLSEELPVEDKAPADAPATAPAAAPDANTAPAPATPQAEPAPATEPATDPAPPADAAAPAPAAEPAAPVDASGTPEEKSGQP